MKQTMWRDSTNANVQVGEIVTYRIEITVPEGTVTNLFILDELPNGMAYVLGSARTDTAGFAGTLGTLSVVPSGVGLGTSGQDVEITLLGNTTVNGDNVGANNRFSVLIDVVVLDVPTNVGLPGNQTMLANTASVTYQGNPSNPAPAGVVFTYVIEPKVEISKSVTPSIVDAGDIVTFMIVATNSGLATAFDIELRDTLDPNYFDISTVNNITLPGGFDVSVETNDIVIRSSPTAVFGDGKILAGELRWFAFEVAISSNVTPNARFTNTAQIVWDTIDKTNAVNEQRTYDPEEAFVPLDVPNLAITKSPQRTSETGPVDTTGSDVTIGEVVTYRIVVDLPETTIPDLMITDNLPLGMAYWSNVVVDTAGFGGTLPVAVPNVSGGVGDGAAVSFTFSGDTLVTGDNNPANNSFAIEFDAIVLNVPSNDGLPATIDGTPQTALTNIATVTYLNNPSNSVPTPPVVLDVVEPSLLIDKTMSQSSGGVVTVTLAVTNRGAATAFDVVVTDLVSTVWFDTTTIAPVSIPNGFTFSVAGAPADAKVTIASDTTSGQPTNSIEVGEVVSFAFEVTLIPGVTGVATNTAVVSEYTTTDGPNPNEREEPPTDDSTTLSFPSFTLTKTVTSPTGRPADIGETVVFTINVENTGPIGFSTVALSDTYDTTYLAFTSATPAETSAGAGAIAWANVGPLPVGASTNILVSFTAVASTTPGDTTNSVVAALTTTNNIPLPPQTSEVPVEVLSPSYTLLKQKIEPTGVATVGQAVVFTITVTNDGEVDLNPVQLDDTYDSAILSFVSASPAADVNLPGSLTWNNVGLIPVGGSSVVTTRFTALVSTWPSDTTNIVVSTASTTNGTPLDPLTSSVPVQVASPGITLIKLAGNAPEGGIHYTNAGAEVIFTYVVTNIGDTYLSDVTVTDDVLGVIGTIPTVLAPGDSATLYYTSAVPAAVTNIGTSIGTPSYTNGLPIPGLTNVVATNDAVVHLFASLGDFVWLDANYNGIQDGGSETGMPSVTVTLYDSTGTNALATTTTDAGGYYFFTNLVPATYVVGFDPPSGYAFTLQDQGGNDAVDNDVDDSTGLTAPVTLEQGENNLTLDAGVFQLAQLGDFVWNDLNADGIQDAGEPGLSNVVVRLYDTNNVVLGTTTTDVNGAYAFTDLYPGTYVVEFDLPVGATFSPQDQGGDDTADSDANTSTGRTAPITLVSAEDNPTIDAGVYFPASLGDFVWNDLNANGIQNPGETGLPNIVVSLYDVSSNVVGVTTTDVNGAYAFTNLVPGTYTVGFDRPLNGNFSPSFAGATTNDSNADVTSGLSDAVTLTSGEHNPTIDAGIYFPASLGDFVWNDFNANGIQNPGETGMPNVVVTLYDNVLNPLMVTTTDVNGAYAFTNLLPGSYFVGFERPGGYEFTLLNQGGDDAVDSDANGTTGLSPLTTLQSGEHNPTVDAGLFARASLGDYVWHDVNWDGIQSGSETGFPGVVVTLYAAASNVLGTTTTDATGFYEFTNLVPNTYFVGVTPPAGFEFTQPNQGGDDTADSDTDLLGFMAPVTLISGENNPTLDSGLFQRASLGDFVWNDLNADGIQDAGEPGFTNVTVNLLSNGVVIATTTTDVNGAYSFTNLYPGTYEVEFLPPAGTTFSPQDEGGDDTIDSDANSTGRTDPVTLISGENNPTLDAGLYIPARLGDYIWHDVNWDGIQGGSETGIPNVVVTLYDAASNVVGTTTTDATGFYEFTNLVPNTYFVGVTPPAGYNLTQQYQGGDSTLDSNADADGFMAPVTLQSGDNDPTLDAGLYIPTSLGDYVWRDDNYNGVQDGAEPGISNVVVTLYDSGNAIVGTTTTDGTGFYEFTNLTPGVYSVGFTPPPNFELTLQFQGGNTNLDSNADQGTGISDSVTLISGDHNPTIDAGMFERASLGDYIWHDYDGNGVQDGSETGMPGVVVHLLDASSNVVNTTTTDSAGYYNFTNLLPGTYAISIETPPGYSITPPFMGGATNDSNLNPLTGVSDFVTLVSGEYNPTIDGGLYIPATLGDTVWHDVDGNGLQDGGSETGMPNVVVHLYNTNDVVIMTTTTDVSGVYLFTNLLPGFYYVGFEPPTGYQFTHKDAGLDDEQDSDADQITGLTDVTQIFSGDEDLSWDAGLYLPASLGDYVWLDEDYDSVQSGSETGMPDIVVNLYDANDVIVGTTTTDVNGAYVFTNLPPGSYTVEFVKGTNFVFVTPLEGGDTSLDSDADQTTGRTDPVVLLSGEHNPTIDAGLAQYGALGDFVWWDINDDGLHAEDLSFYGINDVTIRLFRVTGGVTSLWDVAVTATDTNGQMGWYFFYELPFGDYRVVVDQGNIPNYLPRKTTPMFYNVTISPQYIRFDADFGFNLDPTPITLKSFEATREGDDVRLDWETVSEFENIGYHLYRSESADGPRTRLNGDLIPGQGTGMGAAYTFTDSDVSRTATWYYWLEDVSQTFDTKLHGPAIVRAEAAQPQDESVANFLVDASQPGLYRITYEALAAAGLNPASLETDRIKIALGGSEVAIATYASGSTLKAGDSLLFYVPEGDGALEAQLLTGDNARRMSWAYAAPADEGALWSASVRTDGQLPFTVSPEWQRYMLMGFGESGAIVLDVSNAQNPVMLFGYATLSVQGETGIYLSHDVEESADCIAIEAEAIRSVQDIERP
ncbi:MAG: carboxypeptidase regulatory-like domain-containing protein [Kiritimatiellae bacterium]|nr:carboxypeptidase regulatory-like domain-containing protein [Kiritimatiellia bacterium]